MIHFMSTNGIIPISARDYIANHFKGEGVEDAIMDSIIGDMLMYSQMNTPGWHR